MEADCTIEECSCAAVPMRGTEACQVKLDQHLLEACKEGCVLARERC